MTFARSIASLAVLAIAAQAAAQTAPMPVDAYVDANRPKESASVPSGKASAAIGKWKSKKTEANLLAVKPFGEAGDPEAIRTMMEGYVHLQKSPKDRGASAALADPMRGLVPLAGLWASRDFMVNAPRKNISRATYNALRPCLQGEGSVWKKDADNTPHYQVSSVSNGIDCGFDMRGEQDGVWRVRTNSDPKRTSSWQLPDNIFFVERPVLIEADVDARRAEALLDFVGAYINPLKPEDHAWLTAYGSEDSRPEGALGRCAFLPRPAAGTARLPDRRAGVLCGLQSRPRQGTLRARHGEPPA